MALVVVDIPRRRCDGTDLDTDGFAPSCETIDD